MADLEFTINGAPGSVAAATFQEAIVNAVGLLREFDAALSGKSRGSLRWYVSRLSSAEALSIGFSSKVKEEQRQKMRPQDFSPEVTSTFMSGLNTLETKGTLPPYLSEQGLQKVGALTGLIGKNGAKGFRFRYENTQVDVTAKTQANVANLLPIKRRAIGSVEGRMEAVNLHNGSRFIVYQSVSKKAITCRFNESESINVIRELLGKRVIVFGDLLKNVNGDTLRLNMKTIRQIGGQEFSIADISGLGEPLFSTLPSTEEYLRVVRG